MTLAALENFRKWRLAHRAWRERQRFKELSPQALEALAQTLRDEGVRMWLADPLQIVEAIGKIEQSWALQKTADTAIQLGVMYDLVNRHQDALSIYREASHLFPGHPRVRHEAAIKLLRHGTPQDARDFFESVLAFDTTDAFAIFFKEICKEFTGWVEIIREKLRSENLNPYVITTPVWGAEFARYFVDLFCASALSAGNLPALAKYKKIHFVVFTTADIMESLNKNPLFGLVYQYATVHFICYPSDLTNYNQRMTRHYGETLGSLYCNTCKFLLMSSAHYAALAGARTSDGIVMPMCAEMIWADGSFSTAAKLMDTNIDVVLLTGFRMEEQAVAEINQSFRRADNTITIPPSKIPGFYAKYIPENYFVTSRHYVKVPLLLCWKVGEDGVLVHSTHYQPICVRPAAAKHPLELTIDPIDSRFIERAKFKNERIHFVQDSSIAILGIDKDPTLGTAMSDTINVVSAETVGWWLWQLWGHLRGHYLRLPIRFFDETRNSEAKAVEADAKLLVDEIIALSTSLEERNRYRKTWRFQKENMPTPEKHRT